MLNLGNHIMKKNLYRNVGESHLAEAILNYSALLNCFLWDMNLLGQEFATVVENINALFKLVCKNMFE